MCVCVVGVGGVGRGRWHRYTVFTLSMPASVAQLDTPLTGDQEVAGSTATGSATFFGGDLIMKYFLQSFSPFC